MSDWMSDAQRRRDEQNRQRDTEALRRRQEQLSEEQREAQMLQQVGRLLQNTLVKLGVERKLRDIARKFGHLQAGERIEVTPINVSIETQTYQGSWVYTAPPPTKYPVASQSLIFTSRSYMYTRQSFVETGGWTGATQGSGGGHARGYWTGPSTVTVTDSRKLTVRIVQRAIEVRVEFKELDDPIAFQPTVRPQHHYYPHQINLVENDAERDLHEVEAELDVCLFEAAQEFDTSTYARKPDHITQNLP